MLPQYIRGIINYYLCAAARKTEFSIMIIIIFGVAKCQCFGGNIYGRLLVETLVSVVRSREAQKWSLLGSSF